MLCFIGQNSNAQIHEKKVFPVTDSIFLDSQPVAVLSIHVFHHNRELEIGKDYNLDASFKVLSILTPLKYDTLIVFYQSIPKWLIEEKWHQKPLYNTSGEIPQFQIENNQFTIESVEIFNTLGENIYQNNIKQKTPFEINLANQPKGIYFMIIQNQEKYYSNKIIIE